MLASLASITLFFLFKFTITGFICWISPPSSFLISTWGLSLHISLSFVPLQLIGEIRVGFPIPKILTMLLTQVLFKVLAIRKMWSEEKFAKFMKIQVPKAGQVGFKPRTSRSPSWCVEHQNTTPYPFANVKNQKIGH